MNIRPAEHLLKRTSSVCPECKRSCPAEVWKKSGSPSTVWLRKECEEHGAFEVCLSSDARFYWQAQGNPANACSGETEIRSNGCCSAEGTGTGTLGGNASLAGAPFEKLSTCLALIEIVDSCNLSCPVCYADSPGVAGEKVQAVPLEQIKSRIQGVIERKGKIEILQLSGGEPTIHPQFAELLEWLQSHEEIDYVLLNTNGVRLATDNAFLDQLGKTFKYGKLQVYLQFDGVQGQGQTDLRGVDLRRMREKAIERCAGINLPVTLAMTVIPENLPFLWSAIEFGLARENVRGISFQPLFGSGRGPAQRGDRLNTADIIVGAVEQSGGKLRYEDFTPLPCGDPNCATIGYLLRLPGGVRSISDFVDFSAVQSFLQDKVRYSLDDLEKCGCESEPLGAILKQFELDERQSFRLFIKPFMDVWTWDQDRIDRCCTHVIRPDGKLDSFCRYYAGMDGSETKR